MRVFLDVGTNTGQTIDVVMNPQFKLDQIVGFEPSPICLKMITRKYAKNQRVHIIPFGLSSKQGEMDLFNEGSQGGTVVTDYRTTCNPEHRVTSCHFERASDWFEEFVKVEDTVFLKMNCEGSECDIVNDLLDSGEWGKVDHAFIDFDVRKSQSRAHQEKELLARLQREGCDNLHVFMGARRHDVLFRELKRGL